MTTFPGGNACPKSQSSLAGIGRVARRGFSLLELEVSLIVLGVAFAGLFPTMVMQSRGLRLLETRYAVQGTWYFAPAIYPSDPSASVGQWARKLGAAAALVAPTSGIPGPLPTPPSWLVDDGDSGFSNVGGTWSREENPLAYEGAEYRHPEPPANSPTTPATDHAAWQFTNVIPGWYYIEATWAASPDQAPDAQYVFYDGTNVVGQASANQQPAPSGPTYNGQTWQCLATQYFFSSSACVQLNGQATGYVVADAVRLVPVANDVEITSFQRWLNLDKLTVQVTVNPAVPQ